MHSEVDIMAMTNAERQAAYKAARKGLQVTVTLTPEAKAALDTAMAQGCTQSQAISNALVGHAQSK